jgi:hypothetical protein
MRNVCDKVVEKTPMLCPEFFLNGAVYEIVWENTVGRDKQQMAIQRDEKSCDLCWE